MEAARRLRSASGSSMVLALGVMLAVSILCISMVSTAFTALVAANDQRQREQAYLAATSAAHLVNDVFGNRIENGRDELFPEAMAILGELDNEIRAENDNYYDSSSVDKTLTLTHGSMNDEELAALNSVLNANVTFTKKNNAQVTASISGTGQASYPIQLTFPVYTEVMTCKPYAENGDEMAQIIEWSTYPSGYPEDKAVKALQEKIIATRLPDGAVDCHYQHQKYDTLPAGGGEDTPTVPTPVSLWRVLWQYVCTIGDETTSRRIASVSFIGDDPPTDEEIVSSRPGAILDTPEDPGVDLESTQIWTSNGNWVRTDDKPERTVTCSFAFTAAKRCRIIWMDSSGKPLDSLDYAEGDVPTDPDDEPLKSSESSQHYEYAFVEWTASSSEQDGIPVTTKEPTYRVIVRSPYTIQWMSTENAEETPLDSITLTNDNINIEEPTTDKIPVRVSEGSFYPFVSWDAGTMNLTDPANPVKVYRPQFSNEAQDRYSLIWKDGNGNKIKRLEYGGSFPTDEECNSLQNPDISDNPDYYYYPPAVFEPDPEQSNIYYYQKPSGDFTGWSNEGSYIKTKTALYETTVYAVRQYDVKWLDGNDNVLSSAVTSENNVEPSYRGSTPTKPDDESCSYTFSAWDSGTMCVSDPSNPVKIYKPIFSATANDATTN